MKLVTFEADGHARAGVLEKDDIVDLGASMKEVIISGKLQRGGTYPRNKVRLRAPVPDPAMVLSIGMNYHEHLKEMNAPAPQKPTAFTKSIASIIAAGDPIKVPPSNPNMLDWEGEFSVVIGKPCHRVTAARALEYVFGYTLVNDVSARDWVASIFSAQGTLGPILAWEHNLLGKMFPTFCPMGPCIVTKDELADPTNVRIQTRLNGKVMQNANTDDLVFSVVELIEYYSQFYLFQPGDIITTGSPSGVGYGRDPKIFMKAGDTVEVEVEQIGVLRNSIVPG
jgi:acylpyruvate hydrolase